MPVNTKHVKPNPLEGNFMSPILAPGNHLVKLVSIVIRPETDIAKFGEKLILTLESQPLPEPFKGIQIDKNDPSKGNYNGQIGFVAYSKWGFRNQIFNNVEILRDDEFMRAMQNICRELGLIEWFESKDNVAGIDTVDDLIKAFNSEAPFKDIYFTACLAGRAYLSKDGKHTNHELSFPREDRTLGKAFSLDAKKVQQFFVSQHIEPSKITANSGTIDTSNLVKTTTQATVEIPFEDTQPAKPTYQTSQELDFLNEKKTDSITNSISNDADRQKAQLNGGTIAEDIKKEGIDSSTLGGADDKMPWDLD